MSFSPINGPRIQGPTQFGASGAVGGARQASGPKMPNINASSVDSFSAVGSMGGNRPPSFEERFGPINPQTAQNANSFLANGAIKAGLSAISNDPNSAKASMGMF